MFGAAEKVSSFASCQLPEKVNDVELQPGNTPDFSCGCIQFASGVVARLTCSIVGSLDRSLRIFGDQGTLTVKEAWNFGSPITFRRWSRWSHRVERRPRLAHLVGLGPRRVPLVRRPDFHYRVPGANPIDFCRGVAEMAESIRDDRACRLAADFSLHVNEIVLTLQCPDEMGSPRRMTTSFEPVAPMPWAVG